MACPKNIGAEIGGEGPGDLVVLVEDRFNMKSKFQ